MMRRRFLILSGMVAMVLVLAGCLGGSELAVLTVRFQGMDPNIGQRFEVRLFKQGSPSEIGRSVLDTITNGSFEMEFTGVEEGMTYVLEFFADKNGSGSYDPPPADDAHADFRHSLIDSQLLNLEELRTDELRHPFAALCVRRVAEAIRRRLPTTLLGVSSY